MRRRIVIAIVCLALAGCASLKPEKPPVCDGKHRRPANAYGSVLDTASPPKASPAPEKHSSLSTYGSCRG